MAAFMAAGRSGVVAADAFVHQLRLKAQVVGDLALRHAESPQPCNALGVGLPQPVETGHAGVEVAAPQVLHPAHAH